MPSEHPMFNDPNVIALGKQVRDSTKDARPPKPTRWYRLTSSTGPAAIEACEVVGDKVVKRWQVEEKNVRAVVLARLGDMLDGVEES